MILAHYNLPHLPFFNRSPLPPSLDGELEMQYFILHLKMEAMET